MGFTGSTFGDLLLYIVAVINKAVIPLIFTLAIVVFFWGVVQYVINGDDAEKKTKGRDFMMWGIIGLAVMVGIWGLVAILVNTFNIGPSGSFLPLIPY